MNHVPNMWHLEKKLDEIAWKLTAGAKLAIKNNMRTKLADKIIQSEDFDSRYSSKGYSTVYPLDYHQNQCLQPTICILIVRYIYIYVHDEVILTKICSKFYKYQNEELIQFL